MRVMHERATFVLPRFFVSPCLTVRSVHSVNRGDTPVCYTDRQMALKRFHNVVVSAFRRTVGGVRLKPGTTYYEDMKNGASRMNL
jgi:hypothetical protein